MMFSKTEIKSDLVPLTALVEEQFAESVGELVDLLSERGAAFAVDGSGRLAVTAEFAANLRTERDETQAQEAAEAAERARVAQEAARAQEAVNEAQRAARERYNARVRKLESATGQSIVILEMEMRRQLVRAPDTGMSYDDRQALENHQFSLDEVERWVRGRYGDEMLQEAS